MEIVVYGYVAYNAQIGDSYAVTDSSVALLPQNDNKKSLAILSC